MGKVCFAILAHRNPECLADLVQNLRHFEKDCQIVLFNGGTDPTLGDGLDILRCPYSEPLKWGRMENFQLLTMRWINEIKLNYDYLVSLDSDMLLIRDGFSDYLDKEMKHSEYMALLRRGTGVITPDLHWRPGERFLRVWNAGWKDVFDLPAPYGCRNAPQFFRKEYVDKFFRYKKLDALMKQIELETLSIMEEIIFATMAATLKCNPKNLPNHDKAVRYRKPHSSKEIKELVQQGNVYLIHPAPLDIDTQVRRFVHLLMADQREKAFKMEWSREDVKYNYAPYQGDQKYRSTPRPLPGDPT